MQSRKYPIVCPDPGCHLELGVDDIQALLAEDPQILQARVRAGGCCITNSALYCLSALRSPHRLLLMRIASAAGARVPYY
jgi:hypothetical protein